MAPCTLYLLHIHDKTYRTVGGLIPGMTGHHDGRRFLMELERLSVPSSLGPSLDLYRQYHHEGAEMVTWNIDGRPTIIALREGNVWNIYSNQTETEWKRTFLPHHDNPFGMHNPFAVHNPFRSRAPTESNSTEIIDHTSPSVVGTEDGATA